MQIIWMLFENQSLFVYVIAGVCLWGVLSKLILQGRLHRLLKASETMASTTQRQLRTMRNHYENNLNMDLQIHNMQAFVDKHLLQLRCCGIPIRLWDNMTLEMALLSVATGGLGIINAIHKGYGEEVIYSILMATIVSCACLLTMENIFRIENSIDRLEANIEDYLENNLQNRLGRPLVQRSARGARQTAVTQEAADGIQEQPEAVRVDRTQTAGAGRTAARPQSVEPDTENPKEREASEDYEEIPEYEVRRSTGKTPLQQGAAVRQDAIAEQEAAAGQEAEVVAQVLRNFFSS